MILHTPGGLVLAASQIARALRDHDGRVVAVVPHYAMSGGTLIALAADEIMLEAHAALGPVDPQLGQYPAASLVEVAARPGRHDDQTLLLADVGRASPSPRRTTRGLDHIPSRGMRAAVLALVLVPPGGDRGRGRSFRARPSQHRL